MEKTLINVNRKFNMFITKNSINMRELRKTNEELREELKKKDLLLQKALNDNKILKEKQIKQNIKIQNIKERLQRDISQSDYKNYTILKYFDNNNDKINYYDEFINDKDSKQKVINKGLINKIKENNEEISKLKELLKQKVKEQITMKKILNKNNTVNYFSTSCTTNSNNNIFKK